MQAYFIVDRNILSIHRYYSLSKKIFRTLSYHIPSGADSSMPFRAKWRGFGNKHRQSASPGGHLFQLDHSDARLALAIVAKAEALDGFVAPEARVHRLAQRARALAVDDRHGLEMRHDGSVRCV